MTTADIRLLRLQAQLLSAPVEQPADAVRQLLAMQSQEYNSALWSVAIRTTSPSKIAVERAIENYQIIRTWPMRGTLHFLHAEDVRWMLDLLAPRATQAAQKRRIQLLGLTDDIVREAENVLRSALKGGRFIKRGEVTELLQDVRGIHIDNQRSQHLIRNFGERGVICLGPNDGNQPTLVLLDEVIPQEHPKPREKGLVELALRYFKGHGPTTLKDFSGWGMLTAKDARFGLAGALPALLAREVAGKTYFQDPKLKPGVAESRLLLSGYDEYLLGYKDRDAVLDPEHAKSIVPGGNGIFLATVVENGKVTGLWRKTIRTRGVTHEYEMFGNEHIDLTEAEMIYKRFLN